MNTILSQPYRRRVSTDRPNREGSQLAASLEGEPGPTPAGRTLPHSYPETRFRRERARDRRRRLVLILVCLYSILSLVVYIVNTFSREYGSTWYYYDDGGPVAIPADYGQLNRENVSPPLSPFAPENLVSLDSTSSN